MEEQNRHAAGGSELGDAERDPAGIDMRGVVVELAHVGNVASPSGAPFVTRPGSR